MPPSDGGARRSGHLGILIVFGLALWRLAIMGMDAQADHLAARNEEPDP